MARGMVMSKAYYQDKIRFSSRNTYHTMQEQNTSSDAQRSSSLSGVRARLIQCLNHKIRQGIRNDTAAFMEVVFGIKPTPYFSLWMKEFDNNVKSLNTRARVRYTQFSRAYTNNEVAWITNGGKIICQNAKRFQTLLLLDPTGHHFRKD